MKGGETARRQDGRTIALGPGIEFDRIRDIVGVLGDSGIGDDCALIEVERGILALSCDLSVEGVHFRCEWLSLEEIGWRAVASALSDLAAEGALPLAVLCAVATPLDAAAQDLVALMRGAGAMAREAGTTIRGGDLSRGPAWAIDVTVLGRAERPVTRTGAAPGDGIWVTGQLGGARAALSAWLAGRDPDEDARERFARPVPRIAAGRWLAGHGAHAMLDLSDGLAGDAGHLAAASAARLVINLERVPADPACAGEADWQGIAAEEFAAGGGEDYELLAAMPAGFDEAEAARFAADCGMALTRIGRVEAGTGALFLREGAPVQLTGYDHFR